MAPPAQATPTLTSALIAGARPDRGWDGPAAVVLLPRGGHRV